MTVKEKINSPLLGVVFEVHFDPLTDEEQIEEIKKACRGGKATTKGIRFIRKETKETI